MRKKIIVILVIVFALGLIGWRSYRSRSALPRYETVAVERGDLKQTVEATGKVESVNKINLRFEVPGVLAYQPVQEGQTVRPGALIANLRLAELNATVAQAQANLNQKLAVAPPADIRYYEAAADSAAASRDQALVDVTSAIQDAVAVLQATLPKLDDALTQADNILGIDNMLANDSFEKALSARGTAELAAAESKYVSARRERDALRAALSPVTLGSDRDTVRAAVDVALPALSSLGGLLDSVSAVLRATPPVDTLTASGLDAKKTTIETSRTAINSQYATVLNQRQTLTDAENAVRVKQAAYDQALSNLDGKANPPREVDVAPYRAALAQAAASRGKAIITAPMGGVITKIHKKVGETVSSADIVAEFLSPHYEVKVDIPETDVPKIQLQDKVTLTLDAFGDETVFSGAVRSIQPGATEIQDVVYYQVTVTLDDTEKPIKPGMTANVSIATAEAHDVLMVPLRLVRTRPDGSKFVRVLVNGVEKEQDVVLGLKGDEGKVEVAAGLTGEESVIVSASS